MARIRLVTLDLDETLWPCLTVIEKAEVAVVDWLDRVAPRLTAVHDLESMRRHRRSLMVSEPAIAHDLTEVRRRSLATLLADQDYAPSIADQGVELFLQHRNRTEPFADVLPALTPLAATYCLISLTNGNADPERTPLRGLFHHRLTPADAGAAKPAPRMFEMAMGLAGAVPAHAVHVGDDPRLDVDAARRLGMATVWVNRDRRQWPADLPPPDLEVADLHRLVRWLDAQDSRKTR